MKRQDMIKKRVEIAEKRILELTSSDNLKKITEHDKIARFYMEKSINRLESAKLIFNASREADKSRFEVTTSYRDYAEAVASSYYSMYYIVHSFLASQYRTKLKEGIRGVHIITEHIILYYLVKTNKLAKHLYEEYMNTLEITAQIQKAEDFQERAFRYAEDYSRSRSSREIFTYNVTASVEEHNAAQAIKTAEEFINTIRQLMIEKI